MPNIQVIATIGPSCAAKEVLEQMVEAGMSVARLNFSWGTHEEHTEFVEKLRAVAAEKGITIPVIQDLSGPRVQGDDGHTLDAGASVITEKDIADLEFTRIVKPEYVAMSFVRAASDIVELRDLLTERGITAKIIAKIERKEALDALEEIIKEADGIMVARGDLGDAIAFETVPFEKKRILERCMEAGKPSIVATEMLTSMTDDRDPSRADITDISQAVLDGASATMLSNETAVGEFPIAVISVMRKVVDEALLHTPHPSTHRF